MFIIIRNELGLERQFHQTPLKLLGEGAVAQWRIWMRHCATSRKVAASIPDCINGIFSLTKSFRQHYGPGVDSDCNRNEYQEYFLGVKAAGAYG